MQPALNPAPLRPVGQPGASWGPGSLAVTTGHSGGERPGAGSAGSAASSPLSAPPLFQVFLTSPTEVAKVRLQTQTQTQTQTQQRRPSASGPSAAAPTCPAPPVGRAPGPKYRGPLHCLALVAREEGLRGLYKGSSALLFRDGHSFATYFLSYAILCEQLTPAGRSRPGERWPGPGAAVVVRLSLVGVDVGGGDGLRSHWHPVPPRGEARCPQHESQDRLALGGPGQSHLWREPRAPSRPGPALGAHQLSSGAPVRLPTNVPVGPSPQMSWACWWPVAVQGCWPGPWPPPWT